MRDYSLKIAEEIQEFLRSDDWNFEPVDENGIIRFNCSLKCKFQRCKVTIQVRKSAYLIICSLPLTADEESRPAVTEFITRANYGLVLGCFEMDLRDGEIRYRTAQYCGDSDILISGEIVKEATVLGFGTFISTILDFVIVAFIVFCIVKAFNKARDAAEKKKKEEEAAAAAAKAAEPAPEPEPTKEELLLAEIRDLLKDRK